MFLVRCSSLPLLSTLLLAACLAAPKNVAFQSRWTTDIDAIWVGPNYWANRLQDWQINNGRLECIARRPMRTVHLLTHRLSALEGDFSTSVRLGPLQPSNVRSAGSSAGFLVGAGRDLDYRAAALIHHSYGESGGLYAGVDASGRLFLRDFEREDRIIAYSADSLNQLDSLTLELTASYTGEGYSLELLGIARDTVVLLAPDIEPSRLVGNIALVSHTAVDGATSYWFHSWHVEGEKTDADAERRLGPIIGSQHTLSRGTLKLTAQLMPVAQTDTNNHTAGTAELQIEQGRSWSAVAAADVVTPGYTATFKIEGWDTTRDVPFRLAYRLEHADGSFDTYYDDGVVRREPVDAEEIVVAAFTGNHNVARPTRGQWAGVDGGWFPWNWGLWFPHSDIVQHVQAHEPDFLFFSGDQVYESASPTNTDLSHPYEDYLYKWYLWYWAFGELTASIPSVTIPDDHDVYHGNVWGAGGKPTPEGLSGAEAQDKGGYKLPAEWVNMVQRTQASHLPDPYDPTPVDQGIAVYYTEVVYGGVSFAVIEDRKFKSAPAPLLPRGDISNGWPRNPDFNPREEADVEGASLLGERQLNFLENWADDWSGGVWTKVLLSQTLLANLATLPDSATTDAIIPSLEILPPESYPDGDKIVTDMDSNGWPQSGRNRALRTIRKAFAVHLAGDQHLGSTIQYGVEEWGDAAYALCVPSIANFWPRRWYPAVPGNNREHDSPRYTGAFEDGFGNKMTVHAVSNPTQSGREPALLHDLAPGYGIARFNRRTRVISLAAWPRWSDPANGDGPYPGWPVAFSQDDNYGRHPVGYLPTVVINGQYEPVVQVVNERSGEVVYTLRLADGEFTPKVFESGTYTIHIGEPGTDSMRTFTGLAATLEPSGRLEVSFE
jgi:alkaline phosphatase D